MSWGEMFLALACFVVLAFMEIPNTDVLPLLRKRAIVGALAFPTNGGSFVKKDHVICVCAMIAAFAVASVERGQGQDKKDASGAHKIVHFGDLKWTPIIKGCDVAPVDGDMNAEGSPFVLRIRCSDGAKVPAHWHPTDENVTVLKGTFLVGVGETFDESKMQTMNVGNFVNMPKEMRHYAMNKGETIVQVHGAGPFKVNWVNPSEVQPPEAAPAATKSKS
jgi:quercetin dioxygenase-like cupin family protein